MVQKPKITLPYRETDATVVVRMLVRPVQVELRAIDVRIADVGVAVHFCSLKSQDLFCSQTGKTSVNLLQTHVGQRYC